MIARIFLLSRIAHETEQRARIDSGRQENSDLNVGQQMRFDAVEQRCANLLIETFRRHGIGSASREDRCNAGIGLGSRGPAASIHWPVSGGQRANVAIESERLWNTAKQMKADETSRFRIS